MNKALLFTGSFVFLLIGVPAQTKSDGTSSPSTAVGNQQNQKKKPKKGEIPAELKEKLEVTEAERSEFREILKNPGVRIVKIWNSPCEYGRVIDLKDTFCLEQSDSINASYFTFPGGADNLAGFSLTKGEFRALRFGAARAFLVDLGEVDLRAISKESKEVKTLNGFPPEETAGGAAKSGTGGDEFQGLMISDRQPSRLNHTYLLRTVTHESSYVGDQMIRLVRRKENLHAFQVVGEKDGVVTFVWTKVGSRSVPVKID